EGVRRTLDTDTVGGGTTAGPAGDPAGHRRGRPVRALQLSELPPGRADALGVGLPLRHGPVHGREVARVRGVPGDEPAVAPAAQEQRGFLQPQLQPADHADNKDDELGELRTFAMLLRRAQCLKRCKQVLPAFRQSLPTRELLNDYENRVPYQFLQLCYFKVNNVPKAIAATYTYLRKNPDDEMMQKNMAFYRTLPNIEDEYFRDLEALAYDGTFVAAAKAFNAENYQSCVTNMEQTLPVYFKAYDDCSAGCEGSREITHFKDFYPSIADHFVEVLHCKQQCEDELTPVVGGFLVEKFVPTMYHYLQFSYYKQDNFKQAISCVASYLLFDKNDTVMKQNFDYYQFHRDSLNLTDEDFNARPEALKYHSQLILQADLFRFVQEHFQPDDEMEIEDGVAGAASQGEDKDGVSDAEFEGEGDYEEGFFSDKWLQGLRERGDVGQRETYT
uniref:Cartilage associated protein n=1 Tax=Petromyzon marinus TaxID=7757 RepID=S4RTL4_PETMA